MPLKTRLAAALEEAPMPLAEPPAAKVFTVTAALVAMVVTPV